MQGTNRFGSESDEEVSERSVKISWTQLPKRAVWLRVSEGPSRQQPSDSLRKPRVRIFNPSRAETPAGKQPGGWEYLDHTADVQIHSWGADLKEAFGAAVVGMFGYMVELDEIDNDLKIQIAVEGHDAQSLLYGIMNECLYCFHTEQFVGKEVIIKSLDTNGWKVEATVKGGLFDPSCHSQGTEIKAVTYSNLQVIVTDDDRAETYVIVDI